MYQTMSVVSDAEILVLHKVLHKVLLKVLLSIETQEKPRHKGGVGVSQPYC